MKRILVGGLLALVLAACGSSAAQRSQSSTSATPVAAVTPTSAEPSPTASSSAGSASATPGNTPPPDSRLLYAVLESPGQYMQNTTIAIAGIDGYARARAHFMPRSTPYAPDVAVLLYPEAHVSARAVYFVDGAGVVRILQPNGAVSIAARFPITQKQQLMSFAVSPDGKQIIASVLTLPAVGSQVPGTGWYQLIGSWNLQVDLATVGGTTVALHGWQAGSEPSQPGGFANIVIAGWDAAGPVAVVGGNWATQNPVFDAQVFYGGHFAHIDTETGLPGTILGSCQDTNAGPWSVAVDGTTVCAIGALGESLSEPPRLTVDAPGRPRWQPVPPAGPFGFPGSFVLSADENGLAMDGAVVSRTGPVVVTTEWFTPQGWLDSRTLIGIERDQKDPGHVLGMAYLQVPDPGRMVRLGFSGTFVGVIE